MKKLAVFSGLAANLALGAAALPQLYYYQMATCPTGAQSGQCVAAQACSSGTCAGTAPTTSNTQGLALGGVGGYKLTICAASGQTLSGAGTMQAYGYVTAEGVWVRNPLLDQAVTASSVRCQSFQDFLVAYSFDRVQFVASGVTVGGGTTLDVLLEGARAGAGR